VSYLVLARKYRPETFDKVVGQEPIARTLQNALKTGRLAHAYLFTGPRGVGKTSMARILAKALQCEKGPTPDPCLVCTRCKAVASGHDLDVIEIDGASNRGIENIRDLRESVRYAATGGKYKVYIVDEVHQITQDAFNAFLKTLEEPPPHVVFVFATTEPRKVPETIRSRCQEFEFRRITDAAIAGHLRDVCAGEKFELESGLDAAIARRARGGLRDALSLLDQLAAFGGGAIRHSSFQELTGFLAPDRVRELFDALLAKDSGKALTWVEAALDRGAAAADLIDQWLDHLRALLHRRSGSTRPPELPGVANEALAKQAAGLDEAQLLGAMQVLIEARRALRDLEDERLVLEMAVVELARIAELPSLRDALQQIAAGGGAAARAPAAPIRQAAASASASATATTVPSATARPPFAATSSVTPSASTASAAPAAAPADLATRFDQMCEAILRESPSLAAQVDAMVAVQETEGTLYVVAKPGRTLSSLPNARLDEATRKLGKKLFGVAWVVRPAPDTARDSGASSGSPASPAPSARSKALDQVRDLFGGQTVAGGEGAGS
jgi:DNA polymerase-3 subunit gamma/tau